MTGGQLAAFAIGGLLTYLVRISFLAFAGRMTELPPRVAIALRMIPPAALAALVLPALLRPDDAPVDLLSPVLLGGVVAAVVARKRPGDLFTPLLVGLGVIVLAQQVLG